MVIASRVDPSRTLAMSKSCSAVLAACNCMYASQLVQGLGCSAPAHHSSLVHFVYCVHITQTLSQNQLQCHSRLIFKTNTLCVCVSVCCRPGTLCAKPAVPKCPVHCHFCHLRCEVCTTLQHAQHGANVLSCKPNCWSPQAHVHLLACERTYIVPALQQEYALVPSIATACTGGRDRRLLPV